MVVKVYGSFRSACTLRVLVCLLEKDVEFEIVHVDLDAGEHKKLDFLLRQVYFDPFSFSLLLLLLLYFQYLISLKISLLLAALWTSPSYRGWQLETFW